MTQCKKYECKESKLGEEIHDSLSLRLLKSSLKYCLNPMLLGEQSCPTSGVLPGSRAAPTRDIEAQCSNSPILPFASPESTLA